MTTWQKIKFGGWLLKEGARLAWLIVVLVVTTVVAVAVALYHEALEHYKEAQCK